MNSMNSVWFIGRMGNDIKLEVSKNNVPYVSFRLAVDKKGDKEPNWIPIVCFRGIAESFVKHLRTEVYKLAENDPREIGKGTLISLKGELNISQYEASNGEKRSKAEVVADDIVILAASTSSSKDAVRTYDYSGPLNPPSGLEAQPPTQPNPWQPPQQPSSPNPWQPPQQPSSPNPWQPPQPSQPPTQPNPWQPPQQPSSPNPWQPPQQPSSPNPWNGGQQGGPAPQNQGYQGFVPVPQGGDNQQPIF